MNGYHKAESPAQPCSPQIIEHPGSRAENCQLYRQTNDSGYRNWSCSRTARIIGNSKCTPHNSSDYWDTRRKQETKPGFTLSPAPNAHCQQSRQFK